MYRAALAHCNVLLVLYLPQRTVLTLSYLLSVQNKNGYGIFSHSETHRQGEDEGDEYVEPTRR
jgi:hypothetical protein